MLNPFRLGPCLHRVVVALNGGHRIQPEVGEVRRVFYRALEISGTRVFTHGDEHLTVWFFTLSQFTPLGLSDAPAPETWPAPAQTCSGIIWGRNPCPCSSGLRVDADAEGVLTAFAEECAKGFCALEEVRSPRAGCPRGGSEALLLHLLNEFFEGSSLEAPPWWFWDMEAFVIRGWAQPACSPSSPPIFC